MLVLVVLVWFVLGCCLLLVLVILFNVCGYLVVACCGCMLFWLSGVFVLFWCCLCLMLLRMLLFVGYCYVCAVLLRTHSAVFGCVGFLSMVCG